MMKLSGIKIHVIIVIIIPNPNILNPLKRNFSDNCFVGIVCCDLAKLSVREMPTNNRNVVPIGYKNKRKGKECKLIE